MVVDLDGKLRRIDNQLGMIHRPKVDLVETWQDEAVGISPAIWSTAIVATGSVDHSVADVGYLTVRLTGPANADTARLTSDQRWRATPDMFGVNTMEQGLTVEFEALFTTVASIENANFFMGLTTAVVNDRTSDNVIGWILDGSDALNSLTDDGSSETPKAVGAPTLTNWHKYMIDIYEGVVVFYIDEAEVSRHTTADAEDLPDFTMFLNFYLPQEAGANGGMLTLGEIKVWPQDQNIR